MSLTYSHTVEWSDLVGRPEVVSLTSVSTVRLTLNWSEESERGESDLGQYGQTRSEEIRETRNSGSDLTLYGHIPSRSEMNLDGTRWDLHAKEGSIWSNPKPRGVQQPVQ